jgi:hypothetical protein
MTSKKVWVLNPYIGDSVVPGEDSLLESFETKFRYVSNFITPTFSFGPLPLFILSYFRQATFVRYRNPTCQKKLVGGKGWAKGGALFLVD